MASEFKLTAVNILTVLAPCIINAYLLEYISIIDPGSGVMITFFQFITILLLYTPQFIWDAFRTGIRAPIYWYIIMALIFAITNAINNTIHVFGINASLQSVLRSSTLAFTLIVGFCLRKSYTSRQIFSSIVVLIGIILLSAVDQNTLPQTVSLGSPSAMIRNPSPCGHCGGSLPHGEQPLPHHILPHGRHTTYPVDLPKPKNVTQIRPLEGKQLEKASIYMSNDDNDQSLTSADYESLSSAILLRNYASNMTIPEITSKELDVIRSLITTNTTDAPLPALSSYVPIPFEVECRDVDVIKSLVRDDTIRCKDVDDIFSLATQDLPLPRYYLDNPCDTWLSVFECRDMDTITSLVNDGYFSCKDIALIRSLVVQSKRCVELGAEQQTKLSALGFISTDLDGSDSQSLHPSSSSYDEDNKSPTHHVDISSTWESLEVMMSHAIDIVKTRTALVLSSETFTSMGLFRLLISLLLGACLGHLQEYINTSYRPSMVEMLFFTHVFAVGFLLTKIDMVLPHLDLWFPIPLSTVYASTVTLVSSWISAFTHSSVFIWLYSILDSIGVIQWFEFAHHMTCDHVYSYFPTQWCEQYIHGIPEELGYTIDPSLRIMPISIPIPAQLSGLLVLVLPHLSQITTTMTSLLQPAVQSIGQAFPSADFNIEHFFPVIREYIYPISAQDVASAAADNITNEYVVFIPHWYAIIAVCITQLMCVTSVYWINSKTNAVTTTLLLTFRKAVSLALSQYIFGLTFKPIHWIATIIVFFGTFLYCYWAPPKSPESASAQPSSSSSSTESRDIMKTPNQQENPKRAAVQGQK